MNAEMEELRDSIDATDAKLLALFDERMRLCERIGQLKRQEREPLVQSEREAQVLSHAAASAYPTSARRFLAELIALSRSLQEQP